MTSKSIINVYQGTLTMGFRDSQVKFNLFDAIEEDKEKLH